MCEFILLINFEEALTYPFARVDTMQNLSSEPFSSLLFSRPKTLQLSLLQHVAPSHSPPLLSQARC